MCEKRTWNSLHPTGIVGNKFFILARRSDGMNFQIPVRLSVEFKTNTNMALQIFKNTILEIESYRICSCTAETKCLKHSDKT